MERRECEGTGRDLARMKDSSRCNDGNLNADRYKDEMVLPVVVPIVNAEGLIFQDVNALPHRQ